MEFPVGHGEVSTPSSREQALFSGYIMPAYSVWPEYFEGLHWYPDSFWEYYHCVKSDLVVMGSVVVPCVWILKVELDAFYTKENCINVNS